MKALTSLALLLVAALSACATPSAPEPASRPEPQEPAPPPPAPFTPPVPAPDDADWVRLVSGEWLRGEFTVLRDGNVEFDSDELDGLKLDWDDIAEVRTAKARSILLEDGETLDGPVLVRDGELIVVGATPRNVERARVLAIVRDAERELDYWSGKLTLGLTRRSGNTNQTDFSSYAFARRESPSTRWDTTYNGAVSRIEGDETANNHRVQSRFDWFLSKRLYVTPAGVMLFRDRFQNIALRATPYAALGYDVIDAGRVSWSLSAGPAYQYTRFHRVTPGEDESTTSAAAVLQSRFEWDVTADVEFDFNYDITVPLPDTQTYNHHAALILSVDLIGDLDVDIAFIWDRVNEPVADENGVVPKQDDFRTELGLGWEF